jgi:hypothetical protein
MKMGTWYTVEQMAIRLHCSKDFLHREIRKKSELGRCFRMVAGKWIADCADVDEVIKR